MSADQKFVSIENLNNSALAVPSQPTECADCADKDRRLQTLETLNQRYQAASGEAQKELGALREEVHQLHERLKLSEELSRSTHALKPLSAGNSANSQSAAPLRKAGIKQDSSLASELLDKNMKLEKENSGLRKKVVRLKKELNSSEEAFGERIEILYSTLREVRGFTIL